MNDSHVPEPNAPEPNAPESNGVNELPANPQVDQRLAAAFTQLRMDASRTDAMGALRRQEVPSRPWYLSVGPLVATASVVVALVVGGFVLFGKNDKTTTIETPDAITATDDGDGSGQGETPTKRDPNPTALPGVPANGGASPVPSAIPSAIPEPTSTSELPANKFDLVFTGKWLLTRGVDENGQVFYEDANPTLSTVKFFDRRFEFAGPCSSGGGSLAHDESSLLDPGIIATEAGDCPDDSASDLDDAFGATLLLVDRGRVQDDRLIWAGGGALMEFVHIPDQSVAPTAVPEPTATVAALTAMPSATPIPTATALAIPTAAPTATSIPPVAPTPTATPAPDPELTPGAGPFVGQWQTLTSLDTLQMPGTGPITSLSADGMISIQNANGCRVVTAGLVTDGTSRLEVAGPWRIVSDTCPVQMNPDELSFDAQLFGIAEIEGNILTWRTEGPGPAMGNRATYERVSASAPQIVPSPTPTPEVTAEPGVLSLGAGPFAGSWEMIREHDILFPPGEGPTLRLGTDGSIAGTIACNTFTGQVQSDGESRLTVVVGTGFVDDNQCGVDTDRAANWASLIATADTAMLRNGNLIWVFGGGAEMEFVRIG